MAVLRGMSCCGIQELCDLRGYTSGGFDSVIEKLTRTGFIQLYPNYYQSYSDNGSLNAGSLIFTQADRSYNEIRYGVRFAADVTKRKLGKVIAIPRYTNPNTGNTISVFVWVINKAGLLRYAKKVRDAKEPAKKSVKKGSA